MTQTVMSKIGLIEFLKTKTDKDKLMHALEVIREYKSCESQREWFCIPFDCWKMLEELENMLDYLVNNAELKNGADELLRRLDAGELESLKELNDYDHKRTNYKITGISKRCGG